MIESCTPDYWKLTVHLIIESSLYSSKLNFKHIISFFSTSIISRVFFSFSVKFSQLFLRQTKLFRFSSSSLSMTLHISVLPKSLKTHRNIFLVIICKSDWGIPLSNSMFIKWFFERYYSRRMEFSKKISRFLCCFSAQNENSISFWRCFSAIFNGNENVGNYFMMKVQLKLKYLNVSSAKHSLKCSFHLFQCSRW